MTAQLAILNKISVALAADSAATVIVDGVVKIHQSNKLFVLREDKPIGVMVYGNAEFMGVPWATLINMYRSSATKIQKSTTREYVKDFLKFIKDSKICNADAEVDNAIQLAVSALHSVRIDVNETGRNRTRDKGGPLTRREHNDLFESIIERTLQIINETRRFKMMDSKKLDTIFEKILHEANPLIDQMLDEHLIYRHDRKKFIDVLRRISYGSIERQMMSRAHSGVVIAGFGEHEIFPTLVEAKIDGFVAGTLRVKFGSHHDIGRDGTHAVVVPFAQCDMAIRFMEGIDPVVHEFLLSLEDLVYNFSRTALNARSELTDVQEKALMKAAEKDVGEYLKKLRTFLRDEFWGPIIRVVAHLPQEDLATMAESLVSLTSLKRHVSSEEETVGGPVDVAVVSKGNGFIWVKNKSNIGGAQPHKY